MNEDNKIYMNQIWHKIDQEENKSKIIKNTSKRKKLQTVIYTIFSLILTLCILFTPEILEGISTFIGLVIISIVTHSEYTKLQGGSYEF